MSKVASNAKPEDAVADSLAGLFKALGDPTRIRIIARLARRELCVHELAEDLGMHQSAVSHQLRTLRQLRIVRSRKAGRHVHYQLDDDHVRDLYQRACAHLSHA